MGVLVRVMESRKRRKNAALKEIYARMQAEKGEKAETPDAKAQSKKQPAHRMTKVPLTVLWVSLQVQRTVLYCTVYKCASWFYSYYLLVINILYKALVYILYSTSS